MTLNSADKCNVVVCHSVETQIAFFELLKRLNCDVYEISSLDDLFKHTQYSNFIMIQFYETFQEDLFRSYIIHIPQNASEDNLTITEILKNSLLHKSGDSPELFSRKYNYLTLSEVEKIHIINTLNRCEWRCRTAAKQLGINRTTLYRKMKKYGIRRKK